MTTTTTTTCPGCGLVAEDVETIPRAEHDSEVLSLLSAHGEDILGISFEELRAFIKRHPRTPMSIPALEGALRMAGVADVDTAALRVALLHAHQAGAIYLYKHWFSQPHIPLTGRPPISVTDRWYRDLMVWTDPPRGLIEQNGEELSATL